VPDGAAARAAGAAEQQQARKNRESTGVACKALSMQPRVRQGLTCLWSCFFSFARSLEGGGQGAKAQPAPLYRGATVAVVTSACAITFLALALLVALSLGEGAAACARRADATRSPQTKLS
jgi:hypothetical protein